MPLVPDYASATGPRIARGLYGWVLFCAIAPMVTGVGILALYVITRDDRLPVAGVLFLGIGFALVLIGGGLLVWYQSQQKRAKLIEPAILRKRIRLAIILLLANFAVAAACTALGVREVSGQFFVFTNASNDSLSAVTLTLPDGRKIDFGAVRQGQSVRRGVWITSAWSDDTASLLVIYDWGGSVREKIQLSQVVAYRSHTTGIAFSGRPETRVFTEPSD